MKTKYKYIHLEPSPSGLKNIWHILTNKEDDFLGSISWHPPWRCYTFLPALQTHFSQDCLADIIDFIKQLDSK